MTYGSNGAINFCSLLGGGGQIEATPWRITEIMYRIWVVDDLKWCDRSFRLIWSPFEEACPKSCPSDFVCCILDALFRPYIHIRVRSLKDGDDAGVLLMRILKEEEKLLFGPFLTPLLSDYAPDFNIYRESQRKFSKLFPEIQIMYSRPFLYLKGPHTKIYEIEKFLKKKGSAVCYSSHSMGWEVEGAKSLPPEEYKLISKRREMIARLKSHIGNKIQSLQEKEEAPKSIGGKKFKILTQDGIEPSELLPDFEKNMKKYKIWIDRRKPEVRINNKVQKKMEESTQSIDLLTMLLENHGYCVSHETIFNTFDTKGRKYGTGLKRVDWTTCRTESNKMMSELNDRTHHLLEKPIKHIESVRKKGYKFNLYNAKFCIIYEKEKGE
jgi:DNA-binding response OmpR family regulator